MVPEVVRLEELQLSVIEARCAALLAVGAHEVAVAELKAFVKVHPLREYGCELLSRALYRAGRQADALAELRAIHKRLTEELGIDPHPALQHLEHEILNQEPALDWRPAPAAQLPSAPRRETVLQPPAPEPPPVTDPDKFVGRESELRHMREALADAAAGHGRVVTVSGEPGAGKTSLLRRFAAVAGMPVLWAGCPEHVTAPPLWLWEQILRAAAARFPHRSVPALVAGLLHGSAPDTVDAGAMSGATLRLFEAIVQYLTRVAGTTPVVVLLDHLHRADPLSLQLLAHLAESIPSTRLLLVVSYTPGEAAGLARALAALARSGMTRVELTGLDIEEAQALASAVTGAAVSRPTAEVLRSRTEGNPFFLRELARVLATERGLEQPLTAGVPAPVREVVLRRVAQLPQNAAELLSVAAVAGRSFDINIIARVASTDMETALEIADTAVAAGLIVEDPQRLGWFGFVNAITAEVLYETTGRMRRARLHRRIAKESARAPTGSAEPAPEAARHRLPSTGLDSDAADRDPAHVTAAGREADDRSAFDDAAVLRRQALTAASLSGVSACCTAWTRAGSASSALPARNSAVTRPARSANRSMVAVIGHDDDPQRAQALVALGGSPTPPPDGRSPPSRAYRPMLDARCALIFDFHPSRSEGTSL
jgi:hypothetical protein